MNTTMNAINWPKEYLPGLTDNYVSNEVIVKGITVEAVWEYLTNAATWPSYYSNSSDIKMLNQEDTHLISNTRFFFKTFGFPVDAEVVEYVAPSENQPGRISWHGWAGEVGTAERLDVIHAWLEFRKNSNLNNVDNIYRAIRKDLGHKDSKLNSLDLIRMNLSDPNEI